MQILRPILILFLVVFAGGAAAGAPPACTPFGMAPQDQGLVRLGQLLFYDPILSGGREVACATCHHPDHATGDGVSLGIGDGGKGLGPARKVDPANMPEQRIPRNAPALFNLGAAEFTVMFHDGRLEERSGGRRTPFAPGTIAYDLPMLAAQAKLYGSEMSKKVAHDALQIHGAEGYSRDRPLERYYRDTRMFSIGGGTAQILRNTVAGEVLGMRLPQTRDGYTKLAARAAAE